MKFGMNRMVYGDLKKLFDSLFDDGDVWCVVKKVLKKYDDYVADSIARGLGRVAEVTKDRNAVVEMAKVIGKYEVNTAYCLPSRFTDVARETKDGDAVVEMARVIGEYDDDTADDIAYELGCLAMEIECKDGIKDFMKSINTVHERDPVTARLIAENVRNINSLFGNKYKGILSYMEKRRDREGLYAIARLENQNEVSNVIEAIKMDEFGNKRAERLIKLASYLDASLELELDVSIRPNLQESYDAVERSLHGYMTKLGIKDLEKGVKFVPWLKTKDKTALRVLRGIGIKKTGIARSYALADRSELPLDDMRRDVESCAKTIGVDVSLGNDLDSIGKGARKVMSEAGRKKGNTIAKEMMPRLSRVLNSVHRGSKNFILYVNPSDIETQMEALQNVNSCISPGGIYFEYGQEYLKNPNTFWAVIKDGEKVVGRATVFIGRDPRCNKRLARVSEIRSNVTIKEELVDRALRKYAEEIGAKIMKNGEIKVGGLTMAYDDYIDGITDQGKVAVKRI